MRFPTAMAASLAAGLAIASAGEHLPRSKTFHGESTFRRIVAKAEAGGWHKLPIGERVAKFGKEMHGTAYRGFTLEVDDRVESPSVDFRGLDCWTFFETALGLARMVEGGRYPRDPGALLREIETTRYRGGRCHGHYLDRLHYLAEWFHDNHERGTVSDITRTLPGATRVPARPVREMSRRWQSYRYLRENPSYRPLMAKSEAEVAKLALRHVPKSKVAAIEGELLNGDIVGIVTHKPGVFCSHVGIIYRSLDGKARFMHASTTYKRVVIDKTISGYLNTFKNHAGIIVGRPR